ncbi:MAG: type II toxin-antitoxin system VapC family toxin [Cyclobacteriaceae bacterium]|jgi:predicted nucleic acid-binding protein
MGSGYLIDTNIIVDYLNGNLPTPAKLFLRKVVNDTPKLSVISKIEILSFKTEEESYRLIYSFVESSLVHELSKEVTSAAIQIRLQKRIKIADAIIAATALVFDFTLLTRNTEDFKGITGLKVNNPWLIT